MSSLDADVFRQVMRHVPSTVTVVTAAAGPVVRGVTIGSFTSLSLAPPLICFNLGRASQMYGVLAEAPGFAVHVLAGSQAALSRRFAVPGQTGEAQFDGLTYEVADDGTPLLAGAAALLRCRLHRLVDVGEKGIVIGEVLSAEADDHAPVLLYYRRSYAGLNGTVHPAEASGSSVSPPLTLLPVDA